MAITRDIYRLGFELSPIILTGGVAQAIPGGLLPIVALTQAADFTLGLLQGSVDLNPDDFFAHFRPAPGTSLVRNALGAYPFANQAVAGNAIISQPNNVSLFMTCPVHTRGGYATKFLTMTALKQVLDMHSNLGGTFTVATPSYIFTNCVLESLTDISPGQSKQAQTDWLWTFSQPLLTETQAAEVFNSLFTKIAGGMPFDGEPTWSGLATSIGNTLGGAATSLIETAQNLIGAGANAAQSAAASINSSIGGSAQ